MTAATASQILAPLPPLLLACRDIAGPCRNPWREHGYIYATDGRILARLRDDGRPYRDARTDGQGMPYVGRLFARFRPDGRVIELPAGIAATVPCPRCDGDDIRRRGCLGCMAKGVVPNRRRVAIAPDIALMASRVAMLARHGVRAVEAGTGETSPVRFAGAGVEGLLMTMVGATR